MLIFSPLSFFFFPGPALTGAGPVNNHAFQKMSRILHQALKRFAAHRTILETLLTGNRWLHYGAALEDFMKESDA